MNHLPKKPKRRKRSNAQKVTTTPKCTVALYGRLTREASIKTNLSLPAQRREGIEYTERAGLGPCELFLESDAVGGDVEFSKRTEGSRLLKKIKAGEIKVVVVRDLDRLFHSAKLWSEFRETLLKYGVEPVSYTHLTLPTKA